jgi:hypothetical protein
MATGPRRFGSLRRNSAHSAAAVLCRPRTDTFDFARLRTLPNGIHDYLPLYFQAVRLFGGLPDVAKRSSYLKFHFLVITLLHRVSFSYIGEDKCLRRGNDEWLPNDF